MKRLFAIYFLCLCYLAAGVYAQDLYRWVDEKGGVHFTDNPHSIPEKLRDSAGDVGTLKERRRFLVPFTRDGNHIIVEGIVNGRAAGKFIVDTGAYASTIPGSLAQQLGIDPHKGISITTGGIAGTTDVPLIEIESIKLGGAEVRDLAVSILDLPGSSEFGLLGADFLLEYRVAIQYDKNQLILEALERPYGGHSLKWWQERFRLYNNLKRDIEPARSNARSDSQREWAERQIDLINKRIRSERLKPTFLRKTDNNTHRRIPSLNLDLSFFGDLPLQNVFRSKLRYWIATEK